MVLPGAAGRDTFPVTSCPNSRFAAPAHPAPIQLPLFAEAASLIRVRPERNEWRYYPMEVWPDLLSRGTKTAQDAALAALVAATKAQNQLLASTKAGLFKAMADAHDSLVAQLAGNLTLADLSVVMQTFSKKAAEFQKDVSDIQKARDEVRQAQQKPQADLWAKDSRWLRHRWILPLGTPPSRTSWSRPGWPTTRWSH
jgi:hypothetical protein